VTDRTASLPETPLFEADLLAEARVRASASGQSLMQALELLFEDRPHALLDWLAPRLHFPALDMEALHALEPDFERVHFAQAVQSRSFVARLGSKIIGVTANPFDETLQQSLDCKVGQALEWYLARRNDIEAWLAIQEEQLRAINDPTVGGAEFQALRTPGVDDISIRSITEDSNPVIRLVNSTLYDAMKVAASDIHLETLAGGMQVKYRIDGVLSTVTSVAGLDMAEQVVSRIKVMAELDIGERRVPQDGRFKLGIRGREIDFRVSVMPSLFGEDVVIRILDKQMLTDQFRTLRLDLLGFDAETLEEVRLLADQPYGMLLVTGPTGSGKTTTLYAALSEINSGQDKIITIEDPIEYQLPGVLQIPVNEKKGLTFARGLRSILRHDPDKILVGEIRDAETAQIAIQSALTGHLVFTSVHANNVLDVLGRFLHMGVDTHSFVSALNGIMAQRLIRLLCQECTMPVQPEEALIRRSGLSSLEAADIRFLHGRGCGHCRGTGYKGRHAIGEVLMLTDELRELIVGRAPIRQIKDAARASGTRFLRQAAIDLVRGGRTSLEEANRVTFVL
jgi:general secretion pathway protein E